jgi:hypothetical protein
VEKDNLVRYYYLDRVINLESSDSIKQNEVFMSWFKSGEAAQKAVNDDLVNREKNRKPNRLWLKAGAETEIVFVDDDGVTFYEHNLKLNEQWGNYFTCLKSNEDGDKRCPLCESRFSNSLVTLYTIIDCTEFVDRRGATRKNEIKILAVKAEVAKKILRKKAAQKGSLVGCKFTVFRSSAEAANSGDDFEFVERMDLAQFAAADGTHPKPIDYEKYYKPETYEALSRFLGKPTMAGTTNASPAKKTVPKDELNDAEEIPF